MSKQRRHDEEFEDRRRRRPHYDDEYDDHEYDDHEYDDHEYDDRPRRRRRHDNDRYPDVRRRRRVHDDESMRFIMPVNVSGWAVAAGYLGLISVLCIPAPFAVLAGILAIRELNRDPEKNGMGRAIFGLIMGGLGMTVLLFVFVTLMLG